MDNILLKSKFKQDMEPIKSTKEITMKDIKLYCIDVDSTLTNGLYHVSSNGVITKSFHTQDFWAIRRLLDNGVFVLIITGAKDDCIVYKIKTFDGQDNQNLKICKGVEDKHAKLDYLLKNYYHLDWADVAYIGDATNDLKCLKKVGWGSAPNDAMSIVKEDIHYVCDAKGGEGAVCEFALEILKSKGWTYSGS